MNPVERHIEFLRVLSKAAPGQYNNLCREIERLPRVTVTDAGAPATIIALAARNTAKQFPHAQDETVPALQRALAAMADALQTEWNARGEVPWHIRCER